MLKILKNIGGFGYIKIFFLISIVLVIFKLIFDFVKDNLLISTVIVSAIALFVFFNYRIKLADQVDKKKRFIDRKSTFIASNHYALIENFAKKYGISNPQEEIKLQALLSNKGFNFTTEEINSLISDAFKEAEYNTFKEKILAFNPVQFDDYINSFVRLNLNENVQAIDFIHRLLEEKQFKFGRSDDVPSCR